MLNLLKSLTSPGMDRVLEENFPGMLYQKRGIVSIILSTRNGQVSTFGIKYTGFSWNPTLGWWIAWSSNVALTLVCRHIKNKYSAVPRGYVTHIMPTILPSWKTVLVLHVFWVQIVHWIVIVITITSLVYCMLALQFNMCKSNNFSWKFCWSHSCPIPYSLLIFLVWKG